MRRLGRVLRRRGRIPPVPRIAAAGQAFPVDPAGTEDRNILKVLAPDQTVMPMAVAEIFVRIPFVWLRRIVSRRTFVHRIIRGKNDRALIEVERDVALETD